MTSGLSGSPALTSSRSESGRRARSAWMSIRQTVGGAQSVLTPHRATTSSSASAENRG
jgi:hypothetical protein